MLVLKLCCIGLIILVLIVLVLIRIIILTNNWNFFQEELQNN
jgi:hypothetical protein